MGVSPSKGRWFPRVTRLMSWKLHGLVHKKFRSLHTLFNMAECVPEKLVALVSSVEIV